MSKPRILVVDDDPKLSALIRMILERVGGYQVREENRSFAVLNTAHDFKPHVVLLDVDMPGKDGGMVAAELRKEALFAETPIVFVTSMVSSHESGLRGGKRFLAKPVNAEQLLKTVRELIPALAAA